MKRSLIELKDPGTFFTKGFPDIMIGVVFLDKVGKECFAGVIKGRHDVSRK
jgi:hypothetical protein